MTEIESIFHQCLYFTTNSLSRVITRMAEEEFRITGLSPSHAFLMMLANNHPGIGQKELAKHLNIAPSTVTRFVDVLVNRGYLVRKSEGKTTSILVTEKGRDLGESISRAWKRLYIRYSEILGEEEGATLTRMIDGAGKKLSGTG